MVRLLAEGGRVRRAYHGPAYPAAPAEWRGDGFQREPETDIIGGTFAEVEPSDGVHVVIVGSDGRYWMVDWEAWEDARRVRLPDPRRLVRIVTHSRGPRLYVAGQRVHHGPAAAIAAAIAWRAKLRGVAAALAAWAATDWRDFPFRDRDNH